MDMNLLELEYMIHARKTELEENIFVEEVSKQDKDENRKKYSVRVLGFELRI